MTYMLLIAAAAAVLFWPSRAKLPGLPVVNPAPQIPTFLEATAALADVRRRLVAGDLLGDDQRKAIDVLQLALTAGSDK
jgi:hypothetical protein